MIRKVVKIKDVKPNPSNPRVIKDDRYALLVQSIIDFPEMLEAREVVVNEEMMILGGNMRWRAAQDAKLTEIPVKVVSWSGEQQREFVAKDNANFGEWDWSELANQYEADELHEWGLDIPKDFMGDDDEEEAKPLKKPQITIDVEDWTTEERHDLYNELLDRGYKVKLQN